MIDSAGVRRVLAELHRAGVESEPNGGNPLSGRSALDVIMILGAGESGGVAESSSVGRGGDAPGSTALS
ncbi:hypothetical protein ACIQ9P_04245 [Kitasatospora sp. NPDC094019]|uniref:hypothetical protein n=1 Tax=Kitasatospora sp. NPDC094019 TaxID=3364091 RepID=UPI0037F5A273